MKKAITLCTAMFIILSLTTSSAHGMWYKGPQKTSLLTPDKTPNNSNTQHNSQKNTPNNPTAQNNKSSFSAKNGQNNSTSYHQSSPQKNYGSCK